MNDSGDKNNVFHVIQTESEKIRHDYQERIKELNCLNETSKIVHDNAIALEDKLAAIVDLLPPAWQYPEITHCRIIFKDKTYTTKDFSESKWRQAADLIVDENIIGSVDVFYSEEMPESDEGPFLKEERALINSIADELSNTIGTHDSQILYESTSALFASFMENSVDRFYILDDKLKIVSVNKAIIDNFEYDEETVSSIIGKTLGELFPEDRDSGIIDALVHTLETGEVSGGTWDYPTTNVDFTTFKISDGVGLIVKDITDIVGYQKRLEVLHKSSIQIIEGETV
ncbi:MAG: hypothetical protein KAJ08_10750, partial [Deltaproteobacteria bacterium]|nr:hypothetical protein [Deltaproteobacteria bacterium]